MRSVFVVAALLAAVALASSDINVEFAKGKNLTDAEAHFSYRFQKSSVLSTGVISVFVPQIPKKAYLWSSASVDADATTSKAKADANAMIALAVPPAKYVFPFTILAYAKGSASVDFKLDDVLTSIFKTGSTTFKSTFKGGILGMAALTLEEYTNKGEYVQGSRIILASSSCDPDEVKEKEGVHGLTCTMKFDDDCKVTVTYLTSKQAGILEYGDTPVSPNTIEMVIEVKKFKLSDKKHHVRLNVGMVSASGEGTADGDIKSIEHDGETIYVAASHYADVDGKREVVTVDLKSGSLLDDSSYLTSFDLAMKGTLGGNYDAHIAHIDFPAGATNFIYDPAAGCGENVYKAGASTVTLSLLALIVCVLVYLF